jgi:hypothetical protein
LEGGNGLGEDPHPSSAWVRNNLPSPNCTGLLQPLTLLPQCLSFCPAPAFSPPCFLNPSLHPALSQLVGLSVLLTYSVCVGIWLTLFSENYTSLCISTVQRSLSLSLSLSLSPPPTPIFNCLFCGWAVIKRYLGYSPLGLRFGLPGSSHRKGQSPMDKSNQLHTPHPLTGLGSRKGTRSTTLPCVETFSPTKTPASTQWKVSPLGHCSFRYQKSFLASNPKDSCFSPVSLMQ